MATNIRNYKYHKVLMFGHMTLFDIGGYHRQWVWRIDTAWCDSECQLFVMISRDRASTAGCTLLHLRSQEAFTAVLNKCNPCHSTAHKMYFSFTHSYCRDTQVTFRNRSDMLYDVWTRLSTWCCSVQDAAVQTQWRALECLLTGTWLSLYCELACGIWYYSAQM
jgi:hypothetical protein